MIEAQNLFYEILVDKEIKRQIQILDLLNGDFEYLDLNDFEEKLNVTQKTIKHDIFILKNTLPNTILLSERKGYYKLIKENDDDLQDFIFKLASDTITFKILDYVYRYPSININVLSKEIYTSVSTIKNRIKYINRILKRFKCKISTYSISIIGSEANIRYFYFTYFTELQDIFNISKHQSQIAHAKIYNALQEKTILNKLNRINYDFFQIRQWLLVIKDRIEAGFNVKIQKKFIEQLSSEQTYINFRDVYREIMEKYFEISPLKDDEVVWAYIICLDAIVYSKDFSTLRVSRQEKMLENYSENLNLSLTDVTKKLEIPEEELNDFIRLHKGYFENLYLMNKVTKIFQIATPQFKKYTKNQLATLYKLWYKELNDNKQDYGIVYIEDVCCKLAMISSQFVYRQKPNIQKILFSFTGEVGIISFNETVARNIFSNNVECIFVYNELLSEEIIDNSQAEIIVCNYNTIENFPDKKIIRIPYLPDMKDWSKLLEYIVNNFPNY